MTGRTISHYRIIEELGGGMGVVYSLPEARTLAQRAAHFAGADLPWAVPAVLFATRDTRAATDMFAAMRPKFATDTLFLEVWVPLIEAARMLAAADHKGALAALAGTGGHERRFPALSLLRGQALLGLGRAGAAAAAFEKTLTNHLVVTPTPVGGVAQVWLARAHAKSGDTAAARRVHQDAFTTLKDADADLPLVMQARAEYAALE